MAVNTHKWPQTSLGLGIPVPSLLEVLCTITGGSKIKTSAMFLHQQLACSYRGEDGLVVKDCSCLQNGQGHNK